MTFSNPWFLRYAAGLAALAVIVAPPAVSAAAEPCTAGDASAVRFEKDIQPLLNKRCVMCHVSGAANAGLNMEPGLAYDSLVGAPSSQSALTRVQPGAPEASYLLHKLNGTQVKAGGTGAQMPVDNSPLDAEKIALITAWIKACAPNN